MSTIKLKATDGSNVEFDDKIIGSGGMKDIYFSPDKSYVVGFFRDKQDANAKCRLEHIVGRYQQSRVRQIGESQWKEMYCGWPEKIVEHKGRLGWVTAVVAKHYFFRYGSLNSDSLALRDQVKEGKYFLSPFLKYGQLDPRERGDWLDCLRVCIQIARCVNGLHLVGLALSDLSSNKLLIDPLTGRASIVIDFDDLVVPGMFSRDVIGAPDFIAPEVMRTMKSPLTDKNRKLPSRLTDQHALAVLIYMCLLNRHPLRGRKVHDSDDETNDEVLSMGEEALFIEDEVDTSNRYDVKWVKRHEAPSRLQHLLPWQDIDVLPYKILGPYLSELVKKAFVDGLHNPLQRPSANDWEDALIKTTDLLHQCEGKNCTQKWYVFDNSTRPVCPFCKTPIQRHSADSQPLFQTREQSFHA